MINWHTTRVLVGGGCGFLGSYLVPQLVREGARVTVVDNLESGDIIAFRSPRRGGYVDTIRVQEPVQARAGSTVARRSPPAPRSEVLEGTVERIDDDRAAFDVLYRRWVGDR